MGDHGLYFNNLADNLAQRYLSPKSQNILTHDLRR
jgi:hypothetical protein